MKGNKMKIRKQEQGFTLIELIMVIVIMGILSAVVLPKFFDLEDKTHTKVEEAVIGNIKAGLLTYNVNNLAEEGKKKYPAPSSFALSDVLDDIPDNWSVVQGSGGAGTAVIEYTGRGSGSEMYWEYTTSNSNKNYTIGTRTTTLP